MADQLATPEDLASLLERDDLDMYKATMLVETATAVIQAITGQRIVQVINDVLVVDRDLLDNRRYLDLPEWPATAVSSVAIGVLPITQWVLTRNRLWHPYGWNYLRTGIWANMPYGVTVTYTHGYPLGHQRLQLARSSVLTLCKDVFGNPTGAASLQVGDVRIMYQRAMVAQMETTPYLCAALRRQYSRPPRSAVLTR